MLWRKLHVQRFQKHSQTHQNDESSAEAEAELVCVTVQMF